MRKLYKLDKDRELVYSSKISEFLDPDFIYLPIREGFKVLYKEGEDVLKASVVLENNLNKVLSPVSGRVVGIDKKVIKGNTENCLVIENDFKEQERTIKTRKEITFNKDDIISRLYEYYFKYIASVLETKKINNLIINSIEDEPYMANNEYILQEYSTEILDMMDILIKSFGIPRASLVIKSTDAKNIEKYISKLGSYPEISLIYSEDKYLLGKPFFLLEYLNLSDVDTLVIDVKTLYDMYNAVKYQRNALETFVTIAGQSVEKCEVVKVKIGTRFSEIIKNKIKLKKGSNTYILGGVMTGFEASTTDAIVTSDTPGMIIIPKEEQKSYPCNRCGLCYKVCPVRVNPKKVMDTKKMSANCIDCGLCTYICPCHINLRKFLRGEHE